MDKNFEIPVVMFLFKRQDTLDEIFAVIRAVKPKKMYLIADGGRNEREVEMATAVREKAERNIDWKCEIVKRYSDENVGVYGNIGLGAKFVFEHEESAVFLEDDNLPAVSFFQYCEEMLDRYQKDRRVLWICGTNYLTRYQPEGNSSYMFTRQLLPCGWASWGNKFLATYDFDLNRTVKSDRKRVKATYQVKRLYYQQLFNVMYESDHFSEFGRYYSWDYHMAWSLRQAGCFGISPSVNLIQNIGVDALSEHGGTSLDMDMTQRFCGMPKGELEFPLRHPEKIATDVGYERSIEETILFPFGEWVGIVIKLAFRMLTKFPLTSSIRGKLLRGRTHK